MEGALRDIVPRLDLNVATMRTVYQEYCKVMKVEELSSLEKKEVRRIVRCLFEELNANQGVSINQGDFLPSTHGSAHEPTKKDFDRDSEVDEMKSSQIEEIVQQEYVSSIKDLLVDQKENENGNIIKESSLKSCTKKKRVKRMRLKDVMDFVLDSDDEKVYSSPVECPKKVESARDEFIYEGHVPLRNAASKKTGKQVLDSILYSETDDEFSTPVSTPTKDVNICKIKASEDSPLVKSKSFSKKRNYVPSESESDIEEHDIIVNRTGHPNVNSSIRQNPASKKRRFQMESDSDSEDNLCNNVSQSLNDRRSNDGDSDDMVERSDSGIVCRRTEANREHEAVLRKCSVVLKDCLLNSERHTNGEISMMVVNSVQKNLSSHNTPSRKRISSSSSDDSNGIESFSSSDDEVLAHCPRKGDRSDNVKDENSDVDKNVNSSGDSDTSSHSNVLPLTGGEKVKQKTAEGKLNKAESKQLKHLRAICRRISLILQGCNTDQKKIKQIKCILREKGMKGRPSMKAAEQFELERELRELGGSNSQVIGSRRRACRDRHFFPKSLPAVSASDDFSNLKDVFSAGDSSD